MRLTLQEWKRWWASLSPTQKLWPLVLVLLYWAIYYTTGIIGPESWGVGAAILFLSLGGAASRRLLMLMLPVFFTLMVYQTQVLYADLIRGTIRVFEPYWLDWTFFGVWTPEGRVVPSEWWQNHTHWLLDVVTGIAYLFYFATFILFALYFYYWKGRDAIRGQEFRSQSRAMTWSFFWCNLLGYSTYYWYPAAPPWYLAKYGLGEPDANTPPDQAGTIRFDEFFGVEFFADFYSKSANVFGAIPSLHIAYPLIAVYFAFRLRCLMWITSLNYILVCFSAVYLNHHYVVDLVWGAAYALAISPVVESVVRRGDSNRFSQGQGGVLA